ncbi:MAG: hypothetical protein INR73_22545 [Williamsia sp.]|nr:hypothetical protein [Williamsia sp.]
MQFRKTLVSLLIFIGPLLSVAQSVNLPQGTKHGHFLDRLEILLQDDSNLNFSGMRPLSRKTAVEVAELADSLHKKYPYDEYYHLSKVDQYNLHSLLLNNAEWVRGNKDSFLSKKSLWNTFYKTKADLFQVDEKDFFLAVNPVIQEQQSLETGNSQRIFLNTRGVTARGLIAKKLGFDFYITENQERPPLFVQRWEDKFSAVPGAGFYKPYNRTAYDYMDARGSIYFSLAKYFHFQFGYDRNFIGNGYRSLLLSDFATNYLFFKINTRVWKLNYTNLFMELIPQNKDNPGNLLLPKKYAAMHRLDVNIAKWLNVGLSEAIVFGRPNRFEFSYLNPVIFLRSAEQQVGSPDNAMLGLDLKANVAHQAQLYGQLVLDEFVLKEITSKRGWWGNKYGMQIGLKYLDVVNIKNLDVQGEINFVRPFTYSHYDSIANYTHYNQPLAHPLGAGFIEEVGIVTYQPQPRWTAQLKMILFTQGADTANRNYGNNIFLLSGTRPYEYGYHIPSGAHASGVNTSLLVSYEIKENVFLDGSFLYRKYSVRNQPALSSNTTLFSVGVRMNMFRREYDY